MIQKKDTRVVFPDSCKEFVRLQANNDFDIYTDPPYVSVIDNLLSIFQPAVCLELGAGIGRMSVYFLSGSGGAIRFSIGKMETGARLNMAE